VSPKAAASIFDANQISGEAAKKIARTCRAWTAQHGGTASIYIIDTHGTFVHQERGDGQVYTNIHTAMLKAQTALQTRQPTSIRFRANAVRLQLHTIATLLMTYFRRAILADTVLAQASPDSIRIRLLKVGAPCRAHGATNPIPCCGPLAWSGSVSILPSTPRHRKLRLAGSPHRFSQSTLPTCVCKPTFTASSIVASQMKDPDLSQTQQKVPQHDLLQACSNRPDNESANST
jgi:hypothetical protein